MSPALRRLLLAAAAIAAAALGVWVYASFDPASSVWFPRCPFKALTGLDCPGCGSQRAVHALLSADFAAAWRANAAFVLALPLMAVVAAKRLWPQNWPRVTRFVGSRSFILTLFALFLAWWAGRNIF